MLLRSLAASLRAAGLLAAGLSLAASTLAAPVTLHLIGVNDFHGNLQSPGTWRRDVNSPAVPAGGIDEIAGYVAAARAANPNTVVVTAGDLVGASPLVSALFHDEGTIETWNRVGLDFSAVGNHEFDDGLAELKRLQAGGCHPTDTLNSCKGAQVGTPVPFEGAKFRFLAANVVDAATGRTIFPAYGIRAFGGARVAFIGMTLKETPTIVTPSGVAGLQFNDEVQTVNALVPQLRARGVEAIVVLVHQGGFQDVTTHPTITDINACASADSSGQLDGSDASAHLRQIVAGLDDAVDLVISGHTHAAYNCQLPNRAGRRIPVTSASAFGRVITEVDLVVDSVSQQVQSVAATNRVVDRSNAAIAPDPKVAAIVSGYAALVSPVANQVIGSIAQALPNTKDAACDMPAGDLIADSQLAATHPASMGGAQLALMNPGGVRAAFAWPSSAAGEGDGNVTYGEAFTVQPFGNSLVTMTLTTQQIRDALEQQFPGCQGQTATRVLLPSAGFSYQWDATKSCGSRISSATLSVDGAAPVTLVDAAGVVQDPGHAWRVTVNNFLATGGDGFGVFRSGTSTLGGAQDIDALGAYLAGFNTTTGHAAWDLDAPYAGRPRIRRVDGGSTCPN